MFSFEGFEGVHWATGISFQGLLLAVFIGHSWQCSGECQGLNCSAWKSAKDWTVASSIQDDHLISNTLSQSFMYFLYMVTYHWFLTYGQILSVYFWRSYLLLFIIYFHLRQLKPIACFDQIKIEIHYFLMPSFRTITVV